VATLAERIYELRRDRRHGASWMARRAVEALVEVAQEDAATSQELFDRLVEAARDVSASRPEVGAVTGALGRVLGGAQRLVHLPPEELRRVVEEEGAAITAARRRAAASIAIQLRGRLTDAFVLTHSASATVREALTHTPPRRVYCTVSAPNEEGRDFAEELRAAGLEVELVGDEEAPRAVADASLLLIGADTVFRDGTLCNKIGTRRLALAAADESIPTIVAAEVIKVSPVPAAEAPPLDEEARTLFDLTPAKLIDDVVTEEGIYRADELDPLVNRIPFLAEGYALLRG
jgi:translation initiation factor 2B subunit (eIF-2B alpha/beta/delta family)